MAAKAGRKAARTVDYIPLYVKFGKTLFLLEDKWGNDGSAFWFKLLMQLGAAQDHYLDVSSETQRSRENMDYLVARSHMPEPRCLEILSWLAGRGNIDRELWQERRIIWCQALVDTKLIQSVYEYRKSGVPGRPNPACISHQSIEENEPDFGISLPEIDDGEALDEDFPPGNTTKGVSERVREGGTESPPSSATPQNEEPNFTTRVVMAQTEMQAVDPGLMIGPQQDTLDALMHRVGPETVLAVWRFNLTQKRVKPLRYFLEDFTQLRTAWEKSRPKPPTPRAPPEPIPERTPEGEREAALSRARLKIKMHAALTELEQAAVHYAEGEPLTDHERELLGLQTFAEAET